MSADGKLDLSHAVDKILVENLPTALDQLAQRNQTFQKIATHLENDYIAARRSGIEEQSNKVLTDSKKYLTQSLLHLVNDLNVISNQFDELLHLQDSSLESLACQTDLLQTRILTSKNQKIYSSLDEMQVPYKPEVNAPSTREVPLENINLPYHLRNVPNLPTQKK